MKNVRILSRGMIPPDSNSVNNGNMLAGLLRQLSNCTIMVKSRHRCELSRIEIRRITLGDQAICICRIADNQYFYIATCVVIQ